jgi:glycosyltransferase involved in cell wall biosynthesis
MSINVVMLADTRSVHIKRWARSLVERGLELTLISLGGDDIDRVEIIKLPCSGSRALGFLRQAGAVRELINHIRPDLVHAHYASSYGYWGWRSGFHPFLLSVWGTDIIEFPVNPINRILFKRIVNAADTITATGEFLKMAVRKYIKGDNPPVAVIPFGVKIGPLDRRPAGSGNVRLIFIKVHHKRYGPDILLHAFRIALDKCPFLFLTMAGEGKMTQRLKKMAMELGINDKVEFIGFIDNSEIPRVLSGHDILVMPSRREGFGVTALEAAASGLPTIATNVGGIPEVVIDGQTGLLVPSEDADMLADAIVRLSTQEGLRRDMGQKAREFVLRRYNWDDNVDEMMKIYENLTGNSRR